ncbi:hypothetical protein [Aquabacterium sp.]|uniref:hypothetical protein n=1 Tax=Aquabacterium sp. TaxID=1872578 RepID=UPI002486FDA0|nr:hypothetical protein [Aquabacterium sp.]MDI1258087.1 hypothetical protein [Aquabacterium sp.]
MKNHSLKALSVAVATLFLQSQAGAATDAQLNSVKLYGDVTIAQDSVNGWGPWTEFEPPAAGAPPLAQLPRTSELYRTLPNVAPVADINQNLVGFGGFTNLTIFQGEGGIGEGHIEFDGPHSISLTGTAFGIPTAGSLDAQALQLQTTSLTTGTHPMSESGRMTLDGTEYSSADAQNHRTNLQLIESDLSSEVVEAADVQASFYRRYTVTEYIAGDEIDPNVVERGTIEVGVFGYQTSLKDMDSLRAGGFLATYSGQSVSAFGATTNMTLLVDFGNSRWSGDFDHAGGYQAAGNINGASFSSTRVTAGESTLEKSFVNGNFTGVRAAGAIGISDITRDGVHDVASFLAVQQSLGAQQTLPNAQTAASAK